MKPEDVKQALNDTIQTITNYKWLYSVRPGKDNTRNRKFPFSKMISSILALRGGTLNHEIMDFFGVDPAIGTSSAFIQRRAKILPEAFESLFRYFVQKIDENKLYHGLRMLAVDGSSLQIAADPHDPDSYFPGANGQKAYNLLHINWTAASARKKGGVHSPRDLCKTDHVQLLRIDYPARSHSAGTEKICL